MFLHGNSKEFEIVCQVLPLALKEITNEWENVFFKKISVLTEISISKKENSDQIIPYLKICEKENEIQVRYLYRDNKLYNNPKLAHKIFNNFRTNDGDIVIEALVTTQVFIVLISIF